MNTIVDTVSCFLTTPCCIAISLAHLLNQNYDEELYSVAIVVT